MMALMIRPAALYYRFVIQSLFRVSSVQVDAVRSVIPFEDTAIRSGDSGDPLNPVIFLSSFSSGVQEMKLS